MAILLTIWGILCGLFGFLTWTFSKSPIHEVEAGLAFLTATVAIGCAGIIDAVKKSRKDEKAEELNRPVRAA